MMNSVFHHAFRLPTIKHFMDNALSQLSDGVSGLFLIPKTAPIEDFLQEIRSEFNFRRIDYQEIDLSQENAQISPVSCLCKTVDIQWKDPLTPRLLTLLPDSCVVTGPVTDVVLITGLENQPSETVEIWINATQAWAESGKIFRDRGTRLPSICIALPASKCKRVPNSEIFFKVYCWWGMPSFLETRLLCVESDGFAVETERWRECIVPHLCAGDLFLLPHLVSTKNLDEKEIGASLMQVAQERGWSKDLLTSMGAGKLISMNHSWTFAHESTPAGPLFSLWGEGIVNSNPETGLCLSSPALYVMGRHIEIRHRLWCGQSELVMPLLNMLRLSICNILTKTYGCNWPVEYVEPNDAPEAEAVRENPSNCQFGHLETVLFSWPGRQKVLKSLATYLKRARFLRNELAHNRTIRFSDFQDLRETVDKIVLLLNKEF